MNRLEEDCSHVEMSEMRQRVQQVNAEMKIMVSACLMGENCKYNGGNNRNEKVLRLAAENEMILVCPEQMGGLPTPRVPSEIVDGTFTGTLIDAPGVTAELLMKNGFHCVDVEDLN